MKNIKVFLSENFQFKFSIYLNRRVFVMALKYEENREHFVKYIYRP